MPVGDMPNKHKHKHKAPQSVSKSYSPDMVTHDTLNDRGIRTVTMSVTDPLYDPTVAVQAGGRGGDRGGGSGRSAPQLNVVLVTAGVRGAPTGHHLVGAFSLHTPPASCHYRQHRQRRAVTGAAGNRGGW